MSTETKWTKGPWAVKQSDRWPWPYTISSGERVVVSYDLWTWSTNDTQETANARPENAECAANASLISAAPELYEALVGVLDAVRENVTMPSTVMAAERQLDRIRAAGAAARAALAKARGEHPGPACICGPVRAWDCVACNHAEADARSAAAALAKAREET